MFFLAECPQQWGARKDSCLQAINVIILFCYVQLSIVIASLRVSKEGQMG